jgi:hypothetical protein
MGCAQTPASSRVSEFLRQSLALLAGATLFAAAGLANAATLFDEDTAIEQAVGAITEKLGGGKVRALKLAITPDEVTLQAQDPKDPRHVDEWRFVRQKSFFQRQSVSGPQAVQLSLINKDLEANLFDLDEIQFAASAKLITAAIGRAALEDGAHVTGMEIERQVYIIPTPSSGPVHWTLHIRSGRESAEIIADARGAIIGQDLSGTNRAKNLDMLRQPELAVDAARDFRAALGADRILLKVRIISSGAIFDTNLPLNAAAAKSQSRFHEDKAFAWNLSGLRQALGGATHVEIPGHIEIDPPFSVDEVDWSLLPKIAAAARESLGMPRGRLSDIGLKKSAERVGNPIIQWQIEVTDDNGDNGSVFADTGGSVKQTLLPAGRRKASDWFDPATMVDAFTRIGGEFGSGAKIAQLLFYDDYVRITAQDPLKPAELIDVDLSDQGFKRHGSVFAAARLLPGTRPFTIAELAPLTAERIADLEAKTLARINLPKAQITNITIGRGNMDPSPKGNVTIEIRALVPPFNAPIPPGGRVVYELDGKVIKSYLP